MRARTIAVLAEAFLDLAAVAATKLKKKNKGGRRTDPAVSEAVLAAIKKAGHVTPTMLDAAIGALEARLIKWMVGIALASVCLVLVLLWIGS